MNKSFQFHIVVKNLLVGTLLVLITGCSSDSNNKSTDATSAASVSQNTAAEKVLTGAQQKASVEIPGYTNYGTLGVNTISGITSFNNSANGVQIYLNKTIPKQSDIYDNANAKSAYVLVGSTGKYVKLNKAYDGFSLKFLFDSKVYAVSLSSENFNDNPYNSSLASLE